VVFVFLSFFSVSVAATCVVVVVVVVVDELYVDDGVVLVDIAVYDGIVVVVVLVVVVADVDVVVDMIYALSEVYVNLSSFHVSFQFQLCSDILFPVFQFRPRAICAHRVAIDMFMCRPVAVFFLALGAGRRCSPQGGRYVFATS